MINLNESNLDFKNQTILIEQSKGFNDRVSILGEATAQVLKNTYRVLLTRARQGMVILVPESSAIDHTRPKAFYDETYEYLKEIGIQEIE